MLTVNIHEAKTNLSRLVEEAAKGEAFIIAKAGKPMVKVIPIDAEDRAVAQRIGFMVGEFNVPDDFDAMAAGDIADLFNGQST